MKAPALDADTQALLERMGRDLAAVPAAETLEGRRAALRFMAETYGPELQPVARVADLVVAGSDGPLRLRIYWSADLGEAPPIVLHIHGGGWVLGDPDSYERICRAYCVAGACIVVDVDYRRAPEHKYPVALDDCATALAWVASNAAALGGDPSRIVVTGDSAGGNLAAALCQRTNVPVALQILVYPVMSASAAADYPSRSAFGDGRFFLREADIRRAEEEYFSCAPDREQPGASPILAGASLLSRLPPTCLVTAELDPLRDEGADYAERLRAAGVPVIHECVAGTIHGFVLFGGSIAKGRETIDRIGDWIRRCRSTAPILSR